MNYFHEIKCHTNILVCNKLFGNALSQLVHGIDRSGVSLGGTMSCNLFICVDGRTPRRLYCFGQDEVLHMHEWWSVFVLLLILTDFTDGIKMKPSCLTCFSNLTLHFGICVKNCPDVANLM